ncbi:hypothetical protein [Leisingera thetidis]|uniref:hypothetical protein n=1 Tax=Leisingera thetidis TaxID=2930199 RepID=UPI0033142576
MAFWLLVGTGIAAFTLTVLTGHHLGLIRVLPCKLLLTVDLIAGLAFLAELIVFGFAGWMRSFSG